MAAGDNDESRRAMLAAMRPIHAVDLKDALIYDAKGNNHDEEITAEDEEDAAVEFGELDTVFIVNPC